MGVYAHATHLHLPNREQGRLLAGAMLGSAHPVVICPPYGSWINAYLPMGLSYKDVPEFPTSACIEMNCYDSEGLDIRVYASDRLAFLFESGCGDVAAEEDKLLEIAAQLWEEDPARPVPKSQSVPDTESDAPEELQEAAREAREKAPDFWDLDPALQEPYLAKARDSGTFRKFVEEQSGDGTLPNPAPLKPFLPEGRTIEELTALLRAIHHRLQGPPQDAAQKAALAQWMPEGREHSTAAEDYLGAVARFLGLRGSLWSLETLQEQHASRIDRRIVPLEVIDQRPAATSRG